MQMRICLHNFRCHSQAEYIFPENGMVLLSGKSGAGKSTILNAIYFALFGRIRKPYPLGGVKKGCKVELWHGDIYIVRTRSPNILRVELTRDSQKVVAEDAPAENLICEYFNTSEAEFLASSYIKQKQLGSLLYMSPKEQLDFVEKLAFRDEPIDRFREVCNSIVKELTLQVKLKESNIATLEEQLQQLMSDSITMPKVSTDKIEKWRNEAVGLNKKFHKAQNKLHELQVSQKQQELRAEYVQELESLQLKECDRVAQIQHQLDNLPVPWKDTSKSQASEKRDALSRNIESMEKLQELKNSIKNLKQEHAEEISSLEKKLRALNFQDSDLKKLESLRAEKHNEATREPLVRVLKYLIQHSFMDAMPEYGDVSNLLQQVSKKLRVKKLQKQCEKLESQIQRNQELLRMAQLSKKIRKCPHCRAPLRIHKNEIVAVEEEMQEISCEELQNILERDSQKLKKLRGQIDIAQKGSLLISSLTCTIYSPENASLDLQIQNLESKISQRDKLEARLESEKSHFDKQLKRLKKNMKEIKVTSDLPLANLRQQLSQISAYMDSQFSLENTITSMQRSLEANPYAESLYSLRKRIQAIPVNSTLLNKISKNQSLCEKLQRKISLAEKHSQKVAKYDAYIAWKKQVNNREIAISESQKELQELISNLEAYSRVGVRIKDAEHLALEGAVSSINHEAKKYLKKMFEDQIDVTLKTFRETKTTKSQKPQINTEIYYKGNAYDSLDQISGGEQDRISLGYTVAMSNMFHSPILLLDECLSSLNRELNSEILSQLHRLAKDRLILVVAHEAESGLFDQIVEV